MIPLARSSAFAVRPSCRALASSSSGGGTSGVQAAFQKMVKGNGAKTAKAAAPQEPKTPKADIPSGSALFASKAEAKKKAAVSDSGTAAVAAILEAPVAATKEEPLFPNFKGSAAASEPSVFEQMNQAGPAPTPQHAPIPALQTHIDGFTPRIVVVGCGGAGGNAVNNMIARNLQVRRRMRTE